MVHSAVPAVVINPADGRTDAGSLARHGVEAIALPGVAPAGQGASRNGGYWSVTSSSA